MTSGELADGLKIDKGVLALRKAYGGKGYLALIRQASGSSTVWLEPWMDKNSIRRTTAEDRLPAVRQVVTA